jgi:16S rRNA (uracil1498-N3)-methyltransferase
MDFPFFYVDTILEEGAVITPPEETSRHIMQVLRMREGEQLIITNGHGRSAVCIIQSTSKKSCTILVGEVTVWPNRKQQITIAISLLKNANRFEWFLEKVAELGVSRVVPLQCARTEKQHFRIDRAKTILVSALQQSQQAWLTEITEPASLDAFLQQSFTGSVFIAHCEPSEKQVLSGAGLSAATILIGPEGDFTQSEINAAIQKGFIPVTLGDTRLRTETAGIVAAVKLILEN